MVTRLRLIFRHPNHIKLVIYLSIKPVYTYIYIYIYHIYRLKTQDFPMIFPFPFPHVRHSVWKHLCCQGSQLKEEDMAGALVLNWKPRLEDLGLPIENGGVFPWWCKRWPDFLCLSKGMEFQRSWTPNGWIFIPGSSDFLPKSWFKHG